MKGSKILYDKKRNIIRDTMTRTKGTIDSSMKEKYNLSSVSKPHEYVNVFLPLNKRRHVLFSDEANRPKFEGDFETICKWINMKAEYEGAGPQGSYYPDYVPLTPVEVRQHYAVYILHGLLPSQQIVMKFNAKAKD